MFLAKSAPFKIVLSRRRGRYRQNARFNLLTTDILQMCRYIIQIGTDDVAKIPGYFSATYDLGACKLELGNLRSLMITIQKAKRLEFPFFLTS